MKNVGISAVLGLGLAVGLVLPLAAQSLAEEDYITERLVAARVADTIRKGCPTIEGRMLYALNEAYRLRDWALDRGYSRAAIDAFLKDDEEKRRVYALATTQLEAYGNPSDAAVLCAAGAGEMAAGSIAGSLLRQR